MSDKPEFPYNAYDGFKFTVGSAVDDKFAQVGTAVNVEVHYLGKPLADLELARFEQTVEDKARQKRLLNVLDALGGYLNTGGDLGDLLRVLALLGPLCDQYRVALPEGWQLLDWIYEVIENKYIFSHASGYIGIVDPECYSEVVDAIAFANDLEADEAEHQDEGEGVDEG